MDDGRRKWGRLEKKIDVGEMVDGWGLKQMTYLAKRNQRALTHVLHLY